MKVGGGRLIIISWNDCFKLYSGCWAVSVQMLLFLYLILNINWKQQDFHKLIYKMNSVWLLSQEKGWFMFSWQICSLSVTTASDPLFLFKLKHIHLLLSGGIHTPTHLESGTFPLTLISTYKEISPWLSGQTAAEHWLVGSTGERGLEGSEQEFLSSEESCLVSPQQHHDKMTKLKLLPFRSRQLELEDKHSTLELEYRKYMELKGEYLYTNV